MTFKLPPLPYPRDALEPKISEETLDFHHGKHHSGYVDTLNELVSGSEFEGKPLEKIIESASGELFNNAAQVWNHSFYCNASAPKAVGCPMDLWPRLSMNRSVPSKDSRRYSTKLHRETSDPGGRGW